MTSARRAIVRPLSPVLISPEALGTIDWHTKGLAIRATREQIQQSPDASTELPVARVLESRIHMHYGWETYWPEILVGNDPFLNSEYTREHDPHLQSCRILTGVSVRTLGGEELGPIHDFAVELGAWRIAFIVVHCAKPETVLISTESVRSIDVVKREMSVAL